MASTTPTLSEVDLARGDRGDHPDIRPDSFYLAQIDGRLYGGYFSAQHYGWNFDDGWGMSGHQFDTPGYNYSNWERLWEVVMPGAERSEPTTGKAHYEQHVRPLLRD